MGGSASCPRNGFRKIKKYGSGVFIQLRSNSLYQKRLRKGSTPTRSGRFLCNPTRAAPRALRRSPNSKNFQFLLRDGGWGGAKIKNEKIFLFCGFCTRKSVEPILFPWFGLMTTKAVHAILKLQMWITLIWFCSKIKRSSHKTNISYKQ